MISINYNLFIQQSAFILVATQMAELQWNFFNLMRRHNFFLLGISMVSTDVWFSYNKYIVKRKTTLPR